MHLVDEHRLSITEILDKKQPPLDSIERQANALLLCHKVCKLLLSMYIVNVDASCLALLKVPLFAHLLEHVATQELGHTRLDAWEDCSSLSHRCRHFL